MHRNNPTILISQGRKKIGGITLQQNTPLTFGREGGSGYILPNDLAPGVSRNHIQFNYKDGYVLFTNQSSQNNPIVLQTQAGGQHFFFAGDQKIPLFYGEKIIIPSGRRAIPLHLGGRGESINYELELVSQEYAITAAMQEANTTTLSLSYNTQEGLKTEVVALDRQLYVGRETGCDLHIPSRHIAPFQAKIFHNTQMLYIKNLGEQPIGIWRKDDSEQYHEVAPAKTCELYGADIVAFPPFYEGKNFWEATIAICSSHFLFSEDKGWQAKFQNDPFEKTLIASPKTLDRLLELPLEHTLARKRDE